MARDRTLPAWPNLLQLLLEYFPGTPLSFKIGGGKGFFFFFIFFYFLFFLKGLTRSALIESMLPGGPRRVAGQPRAYKMPLGPFLAHF